ncbi:hypothetical protein Dimus_010865 [Dionaea muscipula]
MKLEKLLGKMGKGGGHIDESFQGLLGKTSGDVGPSGIQKKKITRTRKKKVTTEVAADAEREVPTKASVGEDEENPGEGATQESQAVATKTKPTTKPKKKNMTSPTMGENEMEVGVEGSDEETELNKAANKDAKTVETSAIAPVVSEEGLQNKRRLKKVTDTGLALKKARKTNLPRLVVEEEERGEEAVDTANTVFSPTTAELEKEDQREEDPFGLLYIPAESDGGMSKLLGQTEGTEEPKTSEMVEDEEEKGEMEEIDGDKGDMTTLRIPSSKMVANYMDVMMSPATHATRNAMQSLPLRHKLACLSRSMAKMSLLTGNAIHTAVKNDVRK